MIIGIFGDICMKSDKTRRINLLNSLPSTLMSNSTVSELKGERKKWKARPSVRSGSGCTEKDVRQHLIFDGPLTT